MHIRDLVLPQFFPTCWRDDCGVHGVDFVDVVSLGFVLRKKGAYSYILKHDLRQIDVASEELKSMALMNLSKLRDGVRFHIGRPPGATVIWITAEDNFASVRLLLPEVQDAIRKEIGPEFCFTIPCRDVMLVWNCDAPEEITEKHLREAREDYEAEEYNLSPYAYLYSSEWPCRRFGSQAPVSPA